MSRPLAENIARGRRAVSLARQRGLDTSEWDRCLAEMLVQAGRQPHRDEGVKPWMLWESPAHSSVALLDAFTGWAGRDPKNWRTALRELKRTWEPTGWIPDGPRDLLVAWVAAGHRLVEAEEGLNRLRQVKKPKPHEKRSKLGRIADIGFYGPLARSLRLRAELALESDTEAARLLSKLYAQQQRGKKL